MLQGFGKTLCSFHLLCPCSRCAAFFPPTSFLLFSIVCSFFLICMFRPWWLNSLFPVLSSSKVDEGGRLFFIIYYQWISLKSYESHNRTMNLIIKCWLDNNREHEAPKRTWGRGTGNKDFSHTGLRLPACWSALQYVCYFVTFFFVSLFCSVLLSNNEKRNYVKMNGSKSWLEIMDI